LKKPLPIGLVIGIVAVVVLVLAGTAWQFLNSKPTGPSPEEAAKHMGADSIREAIAKGPPPGPPPPGGERNPSAAWNPMLKR
jgi:hypothetical protein